MGGMKKQRKKENFDAAHFLVRWHISATERVWREFGAKRTRILKRF